MSQSISTNLIVGEEVRYQTKLHWIIELRAVPVFLIALIVFLTGPPIVRAYGVGLQVFTILGFLLLLIGVGYSVYLHLLVKTSDFAITSRRFFIKRGILAKRTFEILNSKAESLSVEQSVLGRLLGYGTIIIGGTGGSKESFEAIQKPTEFRRVAQEEINRVQSAQSLSK